MVVGYNLFSRLIFGILLFFCNDLLMAEVGEGKIIPSHHETNQALMKKTAQIRDIIKRDFGDLHVRPDYPMQDFYIMPSKVDGFERTSAVSDTTPPTNPSNLTVYTESIYASFVRWTVSEDPESGINYYAFGVGTKPDSANLRWWQSVANNPISYSVSLSDLGIAEGDTFYFTVYAVNGDGLASDHVFSSAVMFDWVNLGTDSNELTVDYSDYGFDATGMNMTPGWDSTEIAYFDHFLSRMIPIIKDIYGPPALTNTVTLVKNLFYSGSNIFFPGQNEIHMSDVIIPQLLTHELVHAFRDNVILSSDANWNYHPKLSGFEEAFAQGVSYEAMNKYIEMYPNDMVVDSTYLFGSSVDWDYDFQNTPNITTEDYWSDAGGTGIFWIRYELGAAALKKLYIEDVDISKKFNFEYYSRLNTNHTTTNSRNLIIDIFISVIAQVEGISIVEWIDRQRIFDCQIVTGKKIWLWTQHYPGWQEYLIFQRVLYYETFSNGSEWAYWDGNQWVYHQLNGSQGMGKVTAYNNSVIWQDTLNISIPTSPGFGIDTKNFSTDSDLNPWPGGDTADFVLNMTDFGLYNFELTFDTTTINLHRIMGSELRTTVGIYGGIKNDNGGYIFIDHEDYPDEDSLVIVNGAFWGTRSWATVPNPKTGGNDSKPGKVFIRYFDGNGNEFTAKRNIDLGSGSGNQVFLFDTLDMIKIDVVSIEDHKDAQIKRFSLAQNYPNPFNPATTISFNLEKNGKVTLKVYNILGQVVDILIDREMKEGEHKIVWEKQNVASGIYFYKLSANGKTKTRKMLLLK